MVKFSIYLNRRVFVIILAISNDIFSTKIYDKRDDFDFDIVNVPFLAGGAPHATSNGEYISQPVRFARAPNQVSCFNNRNKTLAAKLLIIAT